jgi:hypothetical protein
MGLRKNKNPGNLNQAQQTEIDGVKKILRLPVSYQGEINREVVELKKLQIYEEPLRRIMNYSASAVLALALMRYFSHFQLFLNLPLNAIQFSLLWVGVTAFVFDLILTGRRSQINDRLRDYQQRTAEYYKYKHSQGSSI